MSRERKQATEVSQEQEDGRVSDKIYGAPSIWEQAERAQRACNSGLNIVKALGERCKDNVFDLFHLKVKWHKQGWIGRDERNVILNPLGGDKGYLDEGELVAELARRCVLSVQGSFRALVTDREFREDVQQQLCVRILHFIRYILSGGIVQYHTDQPPTAYVVGNPTAWLIEMTRNLMADAVSPHRSHHKPEAKVA